MTNTTGTLHEDLCTFWKISHWIPLRMRNVSDESDKENQKIKHITSSVYDCTVEDVENA